MENSSRPLLLIVNPVSGKGQAGNSLSCILSELCRSGRAVTTYMTGGPGDAARFAQEHGPEFETLVCVGGDGTLSEVISGLMCVPQDRRPTIGYIPMGTANDVATTLNLPKAPAAAARLVLTGKPRHLDVGRLSDGRYFSYIAAFGAFTEVSYSTPQDTKRTLGHLAYVLEGMSSLPRIMPYHVKVEYDGGELEDDFVFGGVTNSTSVAGLVKLDPADVGLCDGLFEVILVKNPTSLADFSGIFSGVVAQHYDNETFTFLHTKKIRFSFDREIPWTRDGEAGGTFSSVEAENIKHAINIIV